MPDLKEYYRHAVAARVTEIEDALGMLPSDRPGAVGMIRRAAHSLRGSGGTYGFPEVSAAAGVVEDADETALESGTRRLLDVLRGVSAQAAPKARVLVVDDDPEIALLLRTVLAAPDREISIAPSAAAAAEILKTDSFDVVLLDLLLPDGDGRTVLSVLRNGVRTPRPYVIVLSGKSAAGMGADCLALGADAYMEKPFDPEAIAERVALQLDRRA